MPRLLSSNTAEKNIKILHAINLCDTVYGFEKLEKDIAVMCDPASDISDFLFGICACRDRLKDISQCLREHSTEKGNVHDNFTAGSLLNDTKYNTDREIIAEYVNYIFGNEPFMKDIYKTIDQLKNPNNLSYTGLIAMINFCESTFGQLSEFLDGIMKTKMFKNMHTELINMNRVLYPDNYDDPDVKYYIY